MKKTNKIFTLLLGSALAITCTCSLPIRQNKANAAAIEQVSVLAEPLSSTTWTWSNTPKYNPNDYAFSFMVVGDTQIVSRQSIIDKGRGVVKDGETYMDMIYDYIVESAQTKKVKHVFGLGDITDFNAKNEWELAKSTITKMDNVVPYSLVRGNHDMATNWFANTVLAKPESADIEPYFLYDLTNGKVGSTKSGSVNVQTADKYFATFFNKDSTYGQQYTYCYRGSPTNTIHFFNGTNSLQYMVIALDYGPTDDVLDWASGIISQHPNHNVIVTTHGYMWADGTFITNADTSGMAPTYGENGWHANCGDELWYQFVRKHKNITMLFCGHVSHPTIVYYKSEGIQGNTVTQMLCDPQGIDVTNMGQPLIQTGGDTAANRLVGMVATYYVSADGKNIDVEWYSPIQKAYLDNGQFSFETDAVTTSSLPKYPLSISNDTGKGKLSVAFNSSYESDTVISFKVKPVLFNRVEKVLFNGNPIEQKNGVYTIRIKSLDNKLSIVYAKSGCSSTLSFSSIGGAMMLCAISLIKKRKTL